MLPSKPVDAVRRPDLDLAERCRAGDHLAFEELYRQYATRLYNLARRMAGTPQDADDLLQEIFLQAYRKIGAFRGEAALGTWLYRVATNVCLDHLRSRQGRMMQHEEALDADDPPAHAAPGDGIGIVGRIDLERAIARLPPAARAAFLLHDVEGFEHGEVAAILGVAEGTSKSQVHKARLKLRALLGARARAR